MGTVIAVALLLALLLWLTGAGRRAKVVAPEDDVDTPVDRDELADAEAELARDGGARSIDQALEDDDDWGPGTGGKGALPGIT